MDLLDRLRRDFPDLDAIQRDCIITGGSVRDALLERRPLDLDVSCSDAAHAAARFAREAGGRRITLGTRFQTERVIVKGAVYDFSPLQGGSVEDDLGRRDFTINAIGLDLTAHLIDPFGGRADLESGIVRMIREENLVDDPLRIVRAPRMTGTLGFDLDPETVAGTRRHHELLGTVAPERVTYELRLILGALQGRTGAEDIRRIGLDPMLFGFELTNEDLEAWQRLQEETGDEERAVAVLSMLLAARSAPDNRTALDRWLWTRSDRTSVEATLNVLAALKEGDASLRLRAAEEGHGPTNRAERVARALEDGDAAARLEMILSGEPSPFDVEPILDGREIARITGVSGKAIGRIKQGLWEEQVLGRITTREEAIAWIRRRGWR